MGEAEVTYRLMKLVVRAAWSQSFAKFAQNVQSHAVLGAVQSCAGCRGMLCWVQCKAMLGVVQSCTNRPAGAEVMLKSSLTVSVVGEAPKDARLHTRSCTHTQKKGIGNYSHPESAVHKPFTSSLVGALLCISAPSVVMVMSIHPSASQGN
jgi:hypothetical protein